MTNFDKIKKMRMKEFAGKCGTRLKCTFCPIAEFCERIIGDDIKLIIRNDTKIRNDIKIINCTKVWVKWLKSEVEE